MAIEVSRPAHVMGGPGRSRAGALLRQADVAAFGALFSARTPVRGIAVYMWTAVALNAAAWLARIIPAVARGGAPGYLRGTGLTVNVVYVQDLA